MFLQDEFQTNPCAMCSLFTRSPGEVSTKKNMHKTKRSVQKDTNKKERVSTLHKKQTISLKYEVKLTW